MSDTEIDIVNMIALFKITLLTVFIILKLIGAITWSWWWVFSPIWIPLVIGILIFTIVGLLLLIRY